MSFDSVNGRMTPVPVVIAEGRTSLHLLVEEATRQLTICNSCRYCEGLCAVFPALERRQVIENGDVSQLANLCHDCRACFDACMYEPPHEFAIDIPKALSAVRLADYQRFVWPRRVPAFFSGWKGLVLGSLIAAAVVLTLAVISSGWSALVQKADGAAGPYDLIPYGPLIGLLLAAGLYSVVVMAFAVRTYWREVGGAPGRFTLSAVLAAVWYAATLRYLRGGGVECYYPEDDVPNAGRRRLHALVAYGFGLCLVSTSAIMQDFVGIEPPYPLLSVPVIAGVIGGLGLLVGCVGLLILKTRSSSVTSFAQMNIKDYGLLVSLAFLALSGLAVLVVRDTTAFNIVFLIHLAAVVEAFAMAPYSKFVHVVFRFAALVRDNLELEEQAAR
jgi:citrate/tricarballylate utilization protein